MLTIMCPNCRHRFPAPGCCETELLPKDNSLIHTTNCYFGGLLVPRGYTSGGGCFINGPTIIHDRPQSLDKLGILKSNQNIHDKIQEVVAGYPSFGESPGNESPGCHIKTTNDLTGGSVTITTPSIQSGGCLIQGNDSAMLAHAPRVEIRPKLSGGGCFVQNNIGNEDQDLVQAEDFKDFKDLRHRMLLVPPSGCQELPGTRRSNSVRADEIKMCPETLESKNFQGSIALLGLQDKGIQNSEHGRGSCCCNNVQNLCRVVPNTENKDSLVLDPTLGVQIQVNATVQLPATLGQCTVNITATAGGQSGSVGSRIKNNFNGGGLIQENEVPINCNNEESRDRTPSTPVSWLMPCPWGFDSFLMDKDVSKLAEVKRTLQICGWYHEGLSWQQSECILKETSVGRWLMRDSSDSRFTFAVSVQTARGPTSVRVHYFLEKFRLDAEPRLAFAMPLFDCPIKMLEYYVEYSKSVDEHRKEVWVDYSGQVYSEIYLTRPLVKEIRSLSHLSRLVVNRCKLPTDHLPPLIKNYIQEYPYSL